MRLIIKSKRIQVIRYKVQKEQENQRLNFDEHFIGTNNMNFVYEAVFELNS